jgi:hypothetical protein
MIRISRAPRKAVWLLLIPFLFSSCLWYFYPTDPAPELLLYETFHDIDREEKWYAGAAPGFAENAQTINNRLEVYGPQYYLQTQETFPTDLTIMLEWSVTNGDVDAQLYPVENTAYPDFAITLDELDLTVELSLYATNPEAIREDSVRVLDLFRRDLVEPVSVPTAGVTRGRLEVQITPVSDGVRVEVTAPEIGLVASAVAPTDGQDESQITITVSGFTDDPRSLEELYIFRRPATLGALQ